MKLSDTMQKAVDLARKGKLHRWPGGYWTDRTFDGTMKNPENYVGTQTVMALTNRGLADITDRLDRGDPKEVTLTASGLKHRSEEDANV